MGFFTNVKAIFAAIIAGLVAILYFMFKREQSKADNLEQKTDSLENNIKTIETHNEAKLDVKDFEISKEKKEELVEDLATEDLKTNTDKIKHTPDGQEFEVTL